MSMEPQQNVVGVFAFAQNELDYLQYWRCTTHQIEYIIYKRQSGEPNRETNSYHGNSFYLAVNSTVLAQFILSPPNP